MGTLRNMLDTFARVPYALADPEGLLFRVASRYEVGPLMRFLVRNPKTFNQHIRWRMVHDRNPLFVRLVDKIECKRYVEERLGPGFTPATLAVATRSTDIDAGTLPCEYAIKVNHASGGVVLVAQDFPRGASLPAPGTRFDRFHLHSEDVDFERLGAVLDGWLTQRYGTRKTEWAYSQVKPRILVEEYLKTSSQHPPPDVKFFVFDGRCHAIRLDKYDGWDKSRYHYDRDGVFMPVRIGEFGGPLLPMKLPAPSLPATFLDMREIAEKLGKGLDFVRVDMFELPSRIVVGEMTLYPTAGAARFVPRSYDRWLGAAWPRRKILLAD